MTHRQALAARHAAARAELDDGMHRLGEMLGLPPPAIAAERDGADPDERHRVFAWLMLAAFAVGKRRMAASTD